VDFAKTRVEVVSRWDHHEVVLTITDDGPGFAPEIMDRIGEPYVTSRNRRDSAEGETGGLGLGFFIAKTLLKRSGATLAFVNKTPPEHGAVVTIRWARDDFEPAQAEAAALAR
jgi:two-component system, sensor histidine kinase RegB